MWHFVHISTLKKMTGEPKPIRRKPKGISMRAEKESICPPKKVISSKKSFGSQEEAFPIALLRVRQPPRSQPRCRYYTAQTHTRGTFPCLQQLISTRRAVFLPRFPWFPVCITNFRAFLLFCCGRSMHRKPAISSTFYLLCAIGRP